MHACVNVHPCMHVHACEISWLCTQVELQIRNMRVVSQKYHSRLTGSGDSQSLHFDEQNHICSIFSQWHHSPFFLLPSYPGIILTFRMLVYQMFKYLLNCEPAGIGNLSKPCLTQNGIPLLIPRKAIHAELNLPLSNNLKNLVTHHNGKGL